MRFKRKINSCKKIPSIKISCNLLIKIKPIKVGENKVNCTLDRKIVINFFLKKTLPIRNVYRIKKYNELFLN
jgi:hypothetical protein